MDSIEYPPPSQLLCPKIRTQETDRFRRTELGEISYCIIDNSYYNYDAREDEKALHHLNLFPGATIKMTKRMTSPARLVGNIQSVQVIIIAMDVLVSMVTTKSVSSFPLSLYPLITLDILSNFFNS